MISVLTSGKKVARKKYDCSASEWLSNIGDLRDYTFTFYEWRQIIKARDNDWKISPGDLYLYQRNKYEGNFYTFRAIPEIHDICIKYDYYEL